MSNERLRGDPVEIVNHLIPVLHNLHHRIRYYIFVGIPKVSPHWIELRVLVDSLRSRQEIGVAYSEDVGVTVCHDDFVHAGLHGRGETFFTEGFMTKNLCTKLLDKSRKRKIIM